MNTTDQSVRERGDGEELGLGVQLRGEDRHRGGGGDQAGEAGEAGSSSEAELNSGIQLQRLFMQLIAGGGSSEVGCICAGSCQCPRPFDV
jgi:hypothetical protein